MQNLSSNAALEENIRRYEQYAQVDPDNVLLRSTLGDYYHQAGRFKDALNCYEHCLKMQPKDVRARSRIAMVLISEHRFADAEQHILDLLHTGENDAALWHNLGLAQFYQQQWEKAAHSFSTAVDRGLKLPTNYYYLSRALAHLGKYDEAIAAAEPCLQDGTAAHKGYLALMLMENGDIARGFALAKQVLAQNPNVPEANVVAGTEALEKQFNDEARGYFQRAIDFSQNDGRAWLGIGLIHLYESDFPRAIEALKKATTIYPDNSGMIVTLGWAHIVAKDFVSAQKVFEHALQVDHNFAESHAGLAAALVLQNQFDRAKEEINLAKRLDPRSFGTAVATSFLLAIQGNQQAAANVFGKMLSQSPREGVAPLIDQLRTYLAKRSPTSNRGRDSKLQ